MLNDAVSQPRCRAGFYRAVPVLMRSHLLPVLRTPLHTTPSRLKSLINPKRQTHPPPTHLRPPLPPPNNLMLPLTPRLARQHNQTPRRQPNIHPPPRPRRLGSLARSHRSIMREPQLVKAHIITIAQRERTHWLAEAEVLHVRGYTVGREVFVDDAVGGPCGGVV